MKQFMKTILPLVAILFVGACATTTPTPSELKALRDSVVGEYENKTDENTMIWDFKDIGVMSAWVNGRLVGQRTTWKITNDGELHVQAEGGNIHVFKINKDRSITQSEHIHINGKRTDWQKDRQLTFKKTK